MKYLLLVDSDVTWDEPGFDEAWNLQLKGYWEAFEQAKQALSKTFIDYYMKTALHDDMIYKIIYEPNSKNTRNNVSILFRSYLFEFTYIIQYKNIIRVDVVCGAQLGEYSYGEILYNGKTLSHEFTTSFGGKLFIEAEKMVYQRIKKSNGLSI